VFRKTRLIYGKCYPAALSIAEVAVDIVQDSSDIPAIASAAATVLPASAAPSACSSPQHQLPTSESEAEEIQLLTYTWQMTEIDIFKAC